TIGRPLRGRGMKALHEERRAETGKSFKNVQTLLQQLPKNEGYDMTGESKQTLLTNLFLVTA
ncbi:MAG TPA: hypothetical protein VEC99_08350, partial [Clostridia bacterium]|nr:hypothetical protein [Clostridia bacterium]